MNKQKTKFKLTRIIRRFIQLFAFFLMPGLFISIYSAIKNIYVALIQGTFSFSTQSYDLLFLITVILVTILMGRFFCGYFCAFGSMADFLWFISNKVHKLKFRVSDRTDHILKQFKYVFLAFIIVFIWTLGFASFSSTTNPWTIFGMYVSISGWPSPVYLLSWGALLLLIIVIGSLFIERFFCRYICPLGAIFSVISLGRLFRIKKTRNSCGACTFCTQKCAMGIPLYQVDRVTSGECINCFQCLEACPRKNVSANPVPAVATAMAATAIIGLNYVGTLSMSTSENYSTSSAVSQISSVSPSTEYTDGVYSGTGSGFRGDTTVSVTVSGGKITTITVVSSVDDAQYFNRAVSSIIPSIIEQQSVNVSTVSGATFSSNGIIEAVADALSISFVNQNSSLQRHGH